MPKGSRAKRERMRMAKRLARAAESDEARKARLASNAARIAKKRAEEAPEIRAERLARERQHRKRMREAERRARDLQHHKCAREDETPDQRVAQQAGDAVCHQQVRHARLKRARHNNHNLVRDKQWEQEDDEHQCDTTYVASEMDWFQDSFEMEVTIDNDKCSSVKNRESDLDSDVDNVTGTAELSAPGAEDSCDEQVYVPVIPQRSKMSELLLECEEEELEPWQKRTSQIYLKEEEDDRELSIDQIDCKPHPASLQRNAPPPTLKEETSQPVFLNSQGFIVASPQLTSDTEFISSPRNSLPIVTDGMQKVSPATVTPEAYGVIHTSEVQQISTNLLPSSSVQSPAVYATPSDQTNSQNLSVVLPFPFLTILKLNSTSTTNKL